MLKFGLWRFSLPCYDLPDAGSGGGEADLGDDGESLSDHEASYGDGASRKPAEREEPEPDADPAADTRERNTDGTFKKPRHRAASQQAGPEDVPRIRELTRKHREAEERAIAAERRAEEAERRASERREERRETERQPETPKPAAKPKFPTWEEWQAIDGNPQNDWYAYDDARYEHRRSIEREAERAEQAAATEQREIRELLTAYRTKEAAFLKERPDFHDVVSGERAQTSKVVERAVMAIGPEAAYYLATHDEERLALTEDTLYVHPDNSAFKSAVATTRRYLSTLVAQQRPSPSRTAAGSTGAARASLAPTAPKPPTLVRTGATRDADEPPSDEGSLSDHEKAYGPKRRRA